MEQHGQNGEILRKAMYVHFHNRKFSPSPGFFIWKFTCETIQKLGLFFAETSPSLLQDSTDTFGFQHQNNIKTKLKQQISQNMKEKLL